jgi:prophage regulatory protein
MPATPQSQNDSDRIIGSAELRRRVPYSAMHIWRLEQDGRFPRRIRVGANRVGWSEKEITAWIEERKQARNSGEQAAAAPHTEGRRRPVGK